MSYTVRFRDGEALSISDERADKLKELKLSANPPTDVEIGDNVYRLSQIMSVTKDKLTIADVPDFNKPQLPAGPKCRGQYSIQKEITKLIQHDFGAKFLKHVGDVKLREEYRQKLRESGGPWCDYKVGECACEALSYA